MMGHAYANYFGKTYIVCYRIMPNNKYLTISFPGKSQFKFKRSYKSRKENPQKLTQSQETDSFNNVGVDSPIRLVGWLVVLGLTAFLELQFISSRQTGGERKEEKIKDSSRMETIIKSNNFNPSSTASPCPAVLKMWKNMYRRNGNCVKVGRKTLKTDSVKSKKTTLIRSIPKEQADCLFRQSV